MNSRNRKKTFRWQELNKAMIIAAKQAIEAHNLKYPCKYELKKAQQAHGASVQAYPMNYPLRVKASEQNTIFNTLRDFSKQVARKINKGEKLITNAVFTNCKEARKGSGCKRVTNRHLAKAALVGILRGEEPQSSDDSTSIPKEYIFSSDVSYRPLKRWHGTKSSFELLIDPDLIPKGCLPEGIEISPLDSFKARKLREVSCNTGNLKDEKISNADVDKSTNLPEQETFQAPLQETAKGVEQLQAEIKQLGEKVASEIENGAAAAAEMSKNPTNDKKSVIKPPIGLVSMYTQYVDGQQIEAFADLLLQSYLNKIAPAQNCDYNPGEVQRAREAAKQLLQLCPPDHLEARTEAFLATIDRVQGWIQYSGGYVANPSKWLSPDYERNIVFAFNQYLLPWLQRQKAFEARKPKTNADRNAEKKQLDKDLMKRSTWHNIAFQLKHAFLRFHPTDGRLRKADLNKWAFDLYDIVKKDKFSLDEILKVANWLVEHKGKRAEFWRSKAGSYGIRSASGFRKYFKDMLEQMTQDLINELKFKEEPGKKRLPRYNPTQIPQTKYNPHR